MNELTKKESPYIPIRMDESYKLKITRFEWQFLRWFYPAVMGTQLLAHTMLLELAVYHEWHQKRIARITTLVGSTKVKCSAADMIALKRVLIALPLPGQWSDDRNSLLAKIDPLTVGIQ